MGKSFVSFYTPPKPGAVRLVHGSIGLSKQLMDDVAVRYDEMLTGVVQDLARSSVERKLNGHIGPLHGPGRSAYEQIRRAERVRERTRANIAALGRPAGEFRRAS